MSTTRDGTPSVNPGPQDSVGDFAPIESRRERLLRHGRRARLYAWAVSFVALLVVLIVLIAANLRSVKLDWVVGSTRASLVWIVLAATVLGWLLGITTSVLFRYRTRRPQSRG